MANKKNTYPDWAEKFRGKGKTIRKVKDGYALYKCTSEYVPGSYPKARQEYLGMITEKEGFIPKKTGASAPHYLEYGLSRFFYMNFRREAQRHTFQFNDDLFRLGVIAAVFGKVDAKYIRVSYLTYADADRLYDLAGKISSQKIQRMKAVIEEAFRQKIPNDNNRETIRNLLMICVVEEGPRSIRKPDIPADVTAILTKAELKPPV